MTLISRPDPNHDRDRRTIREQFHAVYTALQEHYPDLAESYASHYPDYTKPFLNKRSLVEEREETDSRAIVENHSEFSRQLVDVIKSLVEEQRESYKEHIKGQRDMFERSDFTTSSAHQAEVDRLKDEIDHLRNRDRPWVTAAIISWIVILITIGGNLYLFLTKLQ